VLVAPPETGRLDTVRNNLTKPSIGHVIMFAAVTVGWLFLFLISLSSGNPGSTFWIKVVFSGLFMVISAVGTVLLWRRSRKPEAPAQQD